MKIWQFSETKEKLELESKKRFSRYFFEIVVLLIGAFALTFMLSVYSLTVSKILITVNTLYSLIYISIFLEYLFLALFGYLFLNLFEITRTAIGRRTPYILFFGITTPFLLTTIQKIAVNQSFTLLFLLLASNFSILLYSLAFFGLLKDKIFYPFTDLFQILLKISLFAGSISGYIYMMNSQLYKDMYIGNETPISGFIFIISAFLVSFLIVEDKKYKVKLSKAVSKAERDSFDNSVFEISLFKSILNLRNLTFPNLELAISLSLIYTNELFLDFPLKTSASLQLVFTIFVILGYYIFILLNKSKSTLATFINSDKFKGFQLIIVGLLYIVQKYVILSNLSFSFLIQATIGFTWGLILKNGSSIIIPSRSERSSIYESIYDFKYSDQRNNREGNHLDIYRTMLLIFFLISLIGILSDILKVVSIENTGLIYSFFSIILSLIKFTKIKNKQSKKGVSDEEVKEID
ncbi:MAG: hypothetical protein ACK4ZM_03030 [bacterium]